MTNLENTIDRIQELIDSEAEPQLRDELNSYHSADLADIFQQIKPEERLKCITLIDEEKAADMIEYLPPQLQVEILGDIDTDLASRLISKLPHDEAADVLGDMEEDESQAYLDQLPKKFSSEMVQAAEAEGKKAQRLPGENLEDPSARALTSTMYRPFQS